MCGRFAFFVEKRKIEERFPQITFQFWPGKRYNICPSQDILGIVFNDSYIAKAFRWGLVPSWSKEPTIGNKLINARSETIATKPSFKKPLIAQRCIIPASGFYEWKREGKQKVPYFIRYASGKPMMFAGLYESWKNENASALNTSTIITRTAVGTIAKIHDRMPVILHDDAIEKWISPKINEIDKILTILNEIDVSEIETIPVSTIVNNLLIDTPECIRPA